MDDVYACICMHVWRLAGDHSQPLVLLYFIILIILFLVVIFLIIVGVLVYNQGNKTALDWAVERGNTEVAAMLRRAGATRNKG